MNKLQNTETKCHVCNGAGYHLNLHGLEQIERECGACHGTGLSAYGRAMNEPFADELKSVFTCQHCGAKKVHYRLHGYKCPHMCEG